jgi:hypothetical protein
MLAYLDHHATTPGRRLAKVTAAFGQPVLGQGQVDTVLEMAQEQAGLSRQRTDAARHGRAL